MEPHCVIRSSILSQQMSKALFRGSIIAGIGGILLLFVGAFLPLESLKIWGFPLFLCGIGLIVFGLRPYKKLRRLEMNPSKITISQDGILIYEASTKEIFTIPIEKIKSISFYENQQIYGMGLQLDKAIGKPKFGFDLFFPYFSRRSVEILQSRLEDVVHFD